jgi:hypothetical protein
VHEAKAKHGSKRERSRMANGKSTREARFMSGCVSVCASVSACASACASSCACASACAIASEGDAFLVSSFHPQ